MPQLPGYELEERLGAGASGVVWAGTRLGTGERVAVKVVRVGGTLEEADEATREFRVLQSVAVDGVVGFREALAVGGDPPTVAIVLDLLEGGSLAGVLAARGHLSVGESVTVLAPIARALAGLHAAGVVHADVSPGNVLFERSGRPVLGDLGVSRLAGEAPGECFGTEGFTAPEVEMGQSPTTASDVYAVGALAWFCATGRPPAHAALRPPLEQAAPGLPAAWSAAVQRCLSPAPADRPTAAEAALHFFDSAPCEPLRLVAGADEVSLLTRRIRCASPPAPVQEAEDGLVTRVRHGVARGIGAALGQLHRVRPTVFVPLPERLRAATGRRAVAGLLAVAAVAGLTAAASVVSWPSLVRAAGGPNAGSEDGRKGLTAPEGPGPASQQVPGKPARPVTVERRGDVTASAPDIRSRQTAPRDDPIGLMQALADARAVVMNTGDPNALGDLDLPGSPAQIADEGMLQRLRSQGQRYAGVAFAVRSASVVRVEGSLAQLTVAVDTLPYRVLDASGQAHSRGGEEGSPLGFHLRWSDGRWLIERLAAEPV